MSKAAADRAREVRWSERGNARLTVRITRAANNALDRLAAMHNCTRRDVVEALLLGNISGLSPNADGLSPDEQLIAAAMRLEA